MNNVRVIINHFFQTAFLVLSCTRRHRPRRRRRRRRTYLSAIFFCCSLFSRLTSSLSLSPPVAALSCNLALVYQPTLLLSQHQTSAPLPFLFALVSQTLHALQALRDHRMATNPPNRSVSIPSTSTTSHWQRISHFVDSNALTRRTRLSPLMQTAWYMLRRNGGPRHGRRDGTKGSRVMWELGHKRPNTQRPSKQKRTRQRESKVLLLLLLLLGLKLACTLQKEERVQVESRSSLEVQSGWMGMCE